MRYRLRDESDLRPPRGAINNLVRTVEHRRGRRRSIKPTIDSRSTESARSLLSSSAAVLHNNSPELLAAGAPANNNTDPTAHVILRALIRRRERGRKKILLVPAVSIKGLGSVGAVRDPKGFVTPLARAVYPAEGEPLERPCQPYQTDLSTTFLHSPLFLYWQPHNTRNTTADPKT